MTKPLKKAIAVMLCVIMTLGIAPLSGFVGLELPGFSSLFSVNAKAEGDTYGDLSYGISNDEVTITDCDKNASGELVIPAEIYGYPVTSIGDYAFLGCTGLTSVTIPDSVTSIGDYAFYGCTGLTSITIPDSVTSIGNYAFHNCTGLTSVTIPDSVTSIGNYAFHNCTGLTSVTIGSSVTGDGAFSKCTGLTSVTIGNSVTTIGGAAFFGCTGLTSITIPDSVTSIGNQAFDGCTGLTSITIPDSVTSIDGWAFCGCTGLTSITIPDGVTSIGDYAFNNCTGLTSVTIPDSVTSIGTVAFSGCTGLTNITIPGSVTTIGGVAFFGCTGLESLTVDENNSAYHGFGNCLIEIATGKLIAGCKNSIIPNDGSVTSIGEWAFGDCTGLTSVTIPDSVTSIRGYAFYGCTGLTSITIPDSVTSIDSSAFYNCTGLTSVTIPDSVTSIGYGAFFGCTGLTSVTIPDSVTSIGDDAFSGCSGLTSITIPDSVTSIGNGAFYGCTGLTSITIPDSVTSIGDYAFSYCPGLESITVDEDNTVYHSSGNCLIETANKTLVAGCKNSVIPDSVTSIGNGAFYYCPGLTSVTIPDSVTSIGNYAFHECTGLTSVTIGNSVTSIGNYAFYSCSGLTDVFYHGTQDDWNQIHISPGNEYLENATIHFLGDEPAHEHSYTETLTKEPTCKEEGVKTFTCTCGDSYTEPVAKLEHTPETITIAATCTEDGAEFQICLVCGDVLSEATVIKATGHNYGEGVITKEATCKEEGVKTFTCSKCGDSYTEPVAKLEHIPGGWVTEKEPTETEAGRAVKKCTLCGDILEQKELPKLEVVKDEETGIELVCAGDDYDGEVAISVEESFDGAAFNVVNTQTGAIHQAVYDVKLLVDGEETQPNGKVKVKIPVPEGYNPAYTFVYHVNTETGKVEKMDAVYENGYMVFETDHFSYYAVVDETPEIPVNPTANAKLNVKSSATVEYKANVTVTATAENVPEGYVLAIYEGSTLREKGSNTSVSYKAGTMTANRTFTVKVIDANKNVQKDANGNELSANCEVKVNSGFFAKIIAFFKGLFGMLPNVEIKP